MSDKAGVMPGDTGSNPVLRKVTPALRRRGSRYSDCLKDDTIMGLSAHSKVVTEPSDSRMTNRVDEQYVGVHLSFRPQGKAV